MDKVEYKWVDISKLFFAVCVVAIHSFIFQGTDAEGWVMPLLLRVAVPYFFVASGFFLGLKCYETGRYNGFSKMGGVLKRLFTKLLVFESIAIVLASMSILYRNPSPVHFILVTIRGIIFNPAGALWYVNALIVAILLLIPAIKRGKEATAMLVSIPLYGFMLLFNRYYFLVAGTAFGSVVDTTLYYVSTLRNGLFVGLLFVSVGLLFAKHLSRLQGRLPLFATITVVAYIALIVESWLVFDLPGADDNAFCISYIVFIPALFATTLLLPSPNIAYAKTLRNLSTSIYFMHPSILRMITLTSLALVGDRPHGVVSFVVGLCVVLAICWFVYRRKLQPFYRWII